MSARVQAAVLVLFSLLASTAGAAGGQSVLFLPGAASSLDDQALLQAVTIYTRDLGYTVETGPRAPAEISGESLGRVAALVQRTHRRLAFWYLLDQRGWREDVVLYCVGHEGGRPTVHALRVPSSSDAEGPYRALGLKLRAVLTGAAALEPQEPVPAPTVPAVIAPQPPPAGGPGTAPESPVPARVEPAGGSRSAPARPTAIEPKAASPASPAADVRRPGPRLRIAAGYRLTLPIDPTLLRHGLQLEAALVLRGWIEPYVGIELSTQPSRALSIGAAELRDLPIRVGTRARWTAGRWTVAGGPMLALHVLDAQAIGFDGTRGDARKLAAGLGADLVGGVRWSDHLTTEVGLLFEYLVPDQRFLLHGVEAFSAGGAIFGISLRLQLAAL